MSEGDWTDFCASILVSIGLALLVEWAHANPFWAAVTGTTFLFFIMVALPLFVFTKSVALKRDVEAKQKMKWGMVVGYFIGLFTLISGILFNIVRGLFAVFGVSAFIGTAVVALAYYAVKDQSRRNEQRRRRALASELEDELEQLKEELSRGIITQEKYEQKKKSLEDQLDQLKAPASI